MSEPVVRPFRRPERDQLTALVNAHVCSVVPGRAVSTAVLLSQVERDPGQYVTDPSVRDRATLVAEAAGPRRPPSASRTRGRTWPGCSPVRGSMPPTVGRRSRSPARSTVSRRPGRRSWTGSPSDGRWGPSRRGSAPSSAVRSSASWRRRTTTPAGAASPGSFWTCFARFGWHRIGSSRRGWERVEDPGNGSVPVSAARHPG